MNTIHKFTLQITDFQTVEMPSRAQILTVQMQGFVPCIWAMVNTTNPKVIRSFEIFGTGRPVSDEPHKRAYIGTFQVADGALVFHLFERFVLVAPYSGPAEIPA